MNEKPIINFIASSFTEYINMLKEKPELFGLSACNEKSDESSPVQWKCYGCDGIGFLCKLDKKTLECLLCFGTGISFSRPGVEVIDWTSKKEVKK